MAALEQDYLDRFSAVGRLLGRAGLERLRDAQVCVVGLGGVGSWTGEALARSGVGAITIVDLDDVCVSNVNRQLPALDGEIGRPKVTVLAERIRRINPACRIDARTEFFTAATAEGVLAVRHDCVVDAIDGMSAKAFLIDACVRRGLPCVTVGGAGGRRDLTRIRSADLGDPVGDDLLRNVRKKLRRDYGWAKGEGNHYGLPCIYSEERPVFPRSDGTCSAEPEPGSDMRLGCENGFGTAVWVTAAFGLAAAQEAVRLIVAAK